VRSTTRPASSGRKPGNRYASRRRLRLREVAIAKSCQFPRPHQASKTRILKGPQTIS
jgi:hypothetical protein